MFLFNKNFNQFIKIKDSYIFAKRIYSVLLRDNLRNNTYNLFCLELLDHFNEMYEKINRSFFQYDRSLRMDLLVQLLIQYTLISHIIYTLALSGCKKDDVFSLGHYLLKNICYENDKKYTGTEEYVVDGFYLNENGEKVDYRKWSTYLKTKNKLPGNVLYQFLNVAKMRRSWAGFRTTIDKDGNEITNYARQKNYHSFFCTDLLWDYIERARKNELTFVEYKREDLTNLKEIVDKLDSISFSKKDALQFVDPYYVEKYAFSVIDRETNEIVKSFRKNGRNKATECLEYYNKIDKEKEKLYSYRMVFFLSFLDYDHCIRRKITDFSTDLDNYFKKDFNECDFEVEDGQTVTYFEFEPKNIINIIKNNNKDYKPYIIRELYDILDNATVKNGKFYSKTKYTRKDGGRFYSIGSYIQFFPKKLRKIVFSKYESIDMNCGVFSLELNLAKNLGYKGKTEQIEKMVSDRKAYRESLVDEKNHISYDDVKDKLTMMGYGCKFDTEKMIRTAAERYNSVAEAEYYGLDFAEPTYYYFSSMYKKETPERMLEIASWAYNKPVLQELYEETKQLGKFLIKKHTKKIDGKKYIINSLGNKLPINSEERKSFGCKLAFIYQSEESRILKDLADNLVINGKKISNVNSGIGLLLHDSIYIHKDLLKKDKNICDNVSNHVKDTFNYNITYEME